MSSYELLAETVKQIPFSGKEKEFCELVMKREHHLESKGWERAIQSDLNESLSAKSEAELTADEKTYLKGNKIAFNFLVQSCTGDVFPYVQSGEEALAVEAEAGRMDEPKQLVVASMLMAAQNKC